MLGARAFVTVGGALWAGSPRGVWPLTASGRPFDDRTGLVDDDVRDLVLDRFGRLWVMGQLGLTVTDKFPRPATDSRPATMKVAGPPGG